MCAVPLKGAAATAGRRCCVRLRTWVLVMLQGAPAVCAWELGWWRHCRAPLLCAFVFGSVHPRDVLRSFAQGE